MSPHNQQRQQNQQQREKHRKQRQQLSYSSSSSTLSLSSSSSSSSSSRTWLLIFFSCTLLYFPLCTHATPVHTTRTHDRGPCVHDSIAELIRKSPVILKALGAHIFTEDDFNGMALSMAGLGLGNKLSGDEQRNEFLASSSLSSTSSSSSTLTTTSSATATATSTTENVWPGRSAMQTHNNAESSEGTATAAVLPAAMLATTTSPEMESILITLTPETIYKGASLLKMSPGSDGAARSSSFVNSNAAESATLYDGQLNATVQPVHCFDSNLLQLLPTELIVFGKLVSRQQQQQEQLPEPQQPQQPHSTKDEDILHISINGLHRWNSQFENHIWKHLGWDDWSDFTLCSVTCGKGVQQRFRRCLLDNPMVNLNMNTLDLSDEQEEEELTADADNDGHVGNGDGDGDDSGDGNGNEDDVIITEENGNNNVARRHNLDKNMDVRNAGGRSSKDIEAQNMPTETTDSGTGSEAATAHVATTNVIQTVPTTFTTRATVTVTTTTTNTFDDDLRHMRHEMTLTSDNNEHLLVANTMNSLNDEMSSSTNTNTNTAGKRIRKLHKKRKGTKGFSTMFCEGYNIEQRNCNTFECSDDISDLLKFYKRPTPYEELTMPPAVSVDVAVSSSLSVKTDAITPATATPAATAADIANLTANGVDVGVAAAAGVGVDDSIGVSASIPGNMAPSTTPANMGYIRSWRNALNFTIMLTLRVKNDSRNTATIFSIRNSTHNLYLDQCQDGLRLYLERDNSTEMLPIKFNLYDYRWHQVAISIQNGDFISIYVDCSWTNSFVVSKRLYTLPFDADAEIGRGFNGELQQLLLLPDNQERHQCSNRRTSINEVKRYIIDTFIGDYGN